MKSSQKKKRVKSTATIADRILPIGETDDYMKVLLYGRSGTGKTHFLGTAPGPILVLDSKEKGTKTLRGNKSVSAIQVEEWSDIEEVYWYLKEGDHPYKTVAIDTITAMQEVAIKQVSGAGKLSRAGWGEVAGLMRTWIMLFRDLNMHVIFTAQDRLNNAGGDEGDDVVMDEEGMLLPELGPAVSPSVAKAVNAAVDVIGQTFIREYEKTVKTKKGDSKTKQAIGYCLRIGPHARFLTKFRTPDSKVKVPRFLTDPTFNQVYNLAINGRIDEDA